MSLLSTKAYAKYIYHNDYNLSYARQLYGKYANC